MNWNHLPFSSRSTPIGLDIGTRAIKAVQVDGSTTRWAVIPRLTESDAIAPVDWQKLKRILHRRGFEGNAVVIAAPAGRLQTEMLQLPPRSSGAPVDKLAAAELSRMAKIEAGTFELACWEIPTTSRGGAPSSLAMALRHSDANTITKSTDSAELTLNAIDTPACAVSRALSQELTPDSVTAVLDVGWSSTNITVLHGSTVIGFRHIADNGLALLHRTIMADYSLGTEEAERVMLEVGVSNSATNSESTITIPANIATRIRDMIVGQMYGLVSELDASLSFASHQYPNCSKRQLLLIGGGAMLDGSAKFWATRVNCEVRVPRMNTADGYPINCVIAAGLALNRAA